MGQDLEMRGELDSELSTREEQRLAELEQIIKDNFRGFVAVGQALAEIREQRLYRQTHSLFEDYCRDLWEMSHQRAFQLEASAKVIDNLATIVATSDGTEIEILPANEAQARELARLQPDEQVMVWSDLLMVAREQSAERGKQIPITAKAVKKAVLHFKGEKLEVAIKQAVREPGEHRTEFESEEFTAAFQAFMVQIDIERRACWRKTSRKSCHKALLTVLEAVAEAGQAVFEPGCAMELADREKLSRGGFHILRMNPQASLIEEWIRNDQWAVHSEYESPAVMNVAFKTLMTDHTNLRG